jgi:chemotaxis protein methyltransferase CheR
MEVVGKDIQNFQHTVRDHSDFDFSDYSHTSLQRRLNRILLELELNMDQLIKQMKSDREFTDRIMRKITVHTTELFRDPHIWKKMKDELLPSLSHQECIRIWHPGCSTGQEVYSMMMVLDGLGLLEKSEIYGSDLHEEVIETARQGRYKYRFNQSYLENFDRVMLNGEGTFSWKQKKHWKKYFHIDEASDTIQMKDFLRQKPVYKKLDLVKDPNLFLVNFDLIVCRNVIIYFNAELQNRVFELFHKNLNEYGSLLLGVHESIMGSYTKKFIRKDPFYYKALV